MNHLDRFEVRTEAFGGIQVRGRIEVALLVTGVVVNDNNAPTQLASSRAPKLLVETRLPRVDGDSKKQERIFQWCIQVTRLHTLNTCKA